MAQRYKQFFYYIKKNKLIFLLKSQYLANQENIYSIFFYTSVEIVIKNIKTYNLRAKNKFISIKSSFFEAHLSEKCSIRFLLSIPLKVLKQSLIQLKLRL
jgi:hypothetical protein